MSLEKAATDVADLVLRDFAQSPAGGAWCIYLDQQRQNPLSGGLGVQSAYERWCEPPGEPPPPPPSQNFSDAGGVACRDYRIEYTTGDTQGNTAPSVTFAKGPIRVEERRTVVDGAPRVVYSLIGGDGVNCPVTREQMAASSNTNIIDVFARVDSITAVGGPLPDELPVPIPPDEIPPDSDEPFQTILNVNVGGFELNVPVVIGPLVFAPIGVFAPVSILPNADFNVPIDFNLNIPLQFGVDLNFEFVVPLGGNPSNPTPLPGQPPIQLPPPPDMRPRDCDEFDYERIEDFILANQCCKPITNVQSVGSFEFTGTNQVQYFEVPDNAVAVFIGIIPSPNARVYKFSGSNSEYGHGNASATVDNNVTDFVRLYANNHVIFYPEAQTNKGVRVSCGKGTIVTVSAGLYVPVEES